MSLVQTDSQEAMPKSKWQDGQVERLETHLPLATRLGA